jgi:hypothetical protein
LSEEISEERAVTDEVELDEELRNAPTNETIQPTKLVTLAAPEEGSYVLCCSRIPISNCNNGRRTVACNRVGILHWRKRVGCVTIEHSDCEHTIGYGDAVNLRPAPVDQENHNRILELSKAGEN